MMSTNRLSYNENFGPVTLSNFVYGVSSGPANQSSESNFFVFDGPRQLFRPSPGGGQQRHLDLSSGDEPVRDQ